jgi:LEA14-like dessication related protein
MRLVKFIFLTLAGLLFIGGYAWKVYYYINYEVKLKGFGLGVGENNSNVVLQLTLKNRNFFAITLYDFVLDIYDKEKTLIAQTNKKDVKIEGNSVNQIDFEINIGWTNNYLSMGQKLLADKPVLIKYKPKFKLWNLIPISFMGSYKLTKDDLG